MNEKSFERVIMIAICVILLMTGATMAGHGKKVTLTLQDGNHVYVLTDAEGKTLKEVFNELGIVLNEGDEVSEKLDTVIRGSMTVNILRQCSATVVFGDNQMEIVLKGAKVRDAIERSGLELPDKLSANYDFDEYIFEGMKIVVTEVVEEQTTEEETEDDVDYDYSWYSYQPSGASSDPAPATTKPATTKPATTAPAATKPAATQSPAETTTAKYIVSDERYDDCDGSGHGVRVITYSDGSQDEIPY